MERPVDPAVRREMTDLLLYLIVFKKAETGKV